MEIRIIPVYRALDEYIAQAEARPEEIDALWEQYAVAPYWGTLCQYAPLDLSKRKPAPIRDIPTLRRQLALLSALDLDALAQAFRRAADALPNFDDDPITIALYPLSNENATVRDKQNGVIGTSLFGNLMIQVNPLAEGWAPWISYVFAHEYHHTVWGNYWFVLHGETLRNTLTDSLVIDGEADAFARSLHPELRPRWLFGLTDAEAQALWRARYAPLAERTNADYPALMFGDAASGIPWCAGYAIGYRIVRAYLEAANAPWLRLLQTNPKDVLAGQAVFAPAE